MSWTASALRRRAGLEPGRLGTPKFMDECRNAGLERPLVSEGWLLEGDFK